MVADVVSVLHCLFSSLFVSIPEAAMFTLPEIVIAPPSLSTEPPMDAPAKDNVTPGSTMIPLRGGRDRLLMVQVTVALDQEPPAPAHSTVLPCKSVDSRR